MSSYQMSSLLSSSIKTIISPWVFPVEHYWSLPFNCLQHPYRQPRRHSIAPSPLWSHLAWRAHPGARGKEVADKGTSPLHTSGWNPVKGVSQTLNRSEQSCNQVASWEVICRNTTFLAILLYILLPSGFPIEMWKRLRYFYVCHLTS